LASGVCFEDHLDWMNFADCHEGNFALAAIATAAGICDFFVQANEIFCDGHCCLHLTVLMSTEA